ncbi:hypothetical protein BFW38_14425 [Terasakiispira papahanaumokuakeensis]|uniref:Sulfur carrier protein FdhD n=1 Tax=Terasakiispira papahanaumokuakeensis TaxID=197479 RepID=A0A1E2VCJ7_9GAMM|nr:formate dehydrogenase accessory sulfurtransferase FdhD [Terasakiispira papahanaumokuakeensis]ODC04546.1 hypothetical protein BFW38_14425 [Terasakiispira papahanaumokuakeensis]
MHDVLSDYEWAADDAIDTFTAPSELVITLSLNHQHYASVLATPEDLDAWALGFALSEGLITRVEQIEAINQQQQRFGIQLDLTLPPHLLQPALEKRRVGTATSSCGRCGSADERLMFEGLLPLPPADLPTGKDWQRLMSALETHSERGLHIALGLDQQQTLSWGRDIGRHNALDKLIGKGLRQHQMPQAALVSSRCSLELIQKSVRAGISCLGTLSYPSTLAIETARLCGLNLVCCHRGRRLQLLSRGRKKTIAPVAPHANAQTEDKSS